MRNYCLPLLSRKPWLRGESRLGLANGPLAEASQDIVHTYIGLGVGGWTLKMTL